VGDCWCGSGGIEANFSRFTCSPTSIASGAIEEPDVGWRPHPFGDGRSCPLEGYADIHAHLNSHLAHGGNIHVGSPAPLDPDGNFALTPFLNVADALDPQDDVDSHSVHLPLSCPVEIVDSPGTPQIIRDLLALVSGVVCPEDPPTTNQDPVGKGTNDVAFGPNGWPIYNGWPHWRSTTHQQMYYKWLERAWRGGLRLMVQLSVTNEALCRTSDGEDCTDSMKAIDKQIDATYDFQRFVDDLHDGPGTGWFRIVTTPLQAREVIAEGKMAVVLGIEMDHLFNCSLRDGAECPSVSHPATVRACPDGEMCDIPPLEPGSTLSETIDWYYQHRGIRHVFPIHNFDNRFGGTATWQNAINAGQAVSVGQWQQTRECPDTAGSLPPNETGYAFSMDPLLLTVVGLFGFDEDDLLQSGNPELPVYPESASCNEFRLTDLGRELLDALTDKGMIIDVDHMSIRTFDDTVEYTRAKYPGAGYPLVASHVQAFDLHRVPIRHERMRTLAQLEAIRESGGMIAAMNKDDVQDTGEKGKDMVVDYVPQLAPAIDNNCRHSSVTYAQAYQYAVDTMGAPVAFGIDFNGVAGHHGPRFGTEACGNFVDPLLDAAFPNLPSVASEEIQAERSQQILFSSKVPYPFTLPGGRWRYGIFDKQQSGTRVDDGAGGLVDLRTWDYNVDGLAHAGLLPDLVRDLQIVGLGGTYMDALFNSAEEYIRVWERSESAATGEPIPERSAALSCAPVALCAGEDNTPPSMTCADVVTECDGVLTDVDFGPEAAGDECGSVSSACSPDSSTSFAVGTRSITCTAADEAGNEAECQFELVVEDTTPPSSVTPPADLPGVECTSPLGASSPLGIATASDLCDPDPTLFNNAPSVFPLGTTNVLWTARDGSGNEGSASQSVTVVDTTPPSITAPGDVVAECEGPGGTSVALGTPVASDICSTVTLSNDEPESFPLGSTNVTWTATDAEGNSAAAIQTVRVEDTTPPDVTLAVAPDLLWPPNHKLVEVVPTVTASDSCDAAPEVTLVDIVMNESDETLTYDPAFDATVGDGHTINDIEVDGDGRIFLRAERSGAGGGRVYTITYQATDASGNANTATATVTVPHDQ
jgi:microsomal dipeptidase-like Zn-dependent dipeptidase